MFDPHSIVVGLEVGTSKITALVAEVAEDETLNLIGVGQAKSRGVRKGEIVDSHAAEEDLRQAIAEAEQAADVEVRSVFLGVTGSHVRGFKNRGSHMVASADRVIDEDDVEDVVRQAKAISLPADHHAIHAIRQHFRLDGNEGIVNPVGLAGTHLEADLHVVHGNVHRLRNAIRAVKALQIEVDDIVFTGMSTSLALLSNEDKELGALVIDLGAGTTEYTVYSGGIIRHTGVVAVGGDHISNDLAYGLKVSLSRAEQLKIQQGGALPDPRLQGRVLNLTSDLGLHVKAINLDHLRRIMSLRLQELFELIAADLQRAGLLNYLRAGAILCGGGSRIPGIEDLAEQVLGIPARRGEVRSVGGLRMALDQPEFAAPIGLVKYASFHVRQPVRVSFGQSIRQTVTQWFRRSA